MIKDGVSAVLRTTARKLTTSSVGRPVAVTHVSQATCPKPGVDSRGVLRWGCPWLGSGCYAESGPEGMVTRQLERSELQVHGGPARPARVGAGVGGVGAGVMGVGGASLWGPSEDARGLWASLAEARAVWGLAAGALPGGAGKGTVVGVPLRLHVVGDACGGIGALVVGRAAVGWRWMGGDLVWTYTHRWREIDRGAWGPAVSVLASCETDAQVLEAKARGYVPALVRGFEGSGPGSERGVPGGIECPQQKGTRADCASCMACARDGRLRAGDRYIVLSPHGGSGGTVGVGGRRMQGTKSMRVKLAGFVASGRPERVGGVEGSS